MGEQAFALEAQVEAYRRLRLASARTGLLGFTRYTYANYTINWHHRRMAQALNDVVEGRCKRLMINVQPRGGKSELVSRRLPAYFLGRYPDKEVMAASYNERFSGDINLEVQKIIDSPEYAEVFPETRLAHPGDGSSAVRNTHAFHVVGRRGRYRAASVSGTATGYGAHLAIIDDPVKNADDVRSLVKRDRVFDWYATTILTRLYHGQGGAIVLCMTRWHEDDLAGRLLRRARENPRGEQWRVLTLPAIAEEDGQDGDPRKAGEALWPAQAPLETLREIRETQGEAHFVALYQQRPSAAEGTVVKRPWWKYWTALPEEIDVLVISADLNMAADAHRTSDYTVFQVWARSGADYYLLDQVRARMNYIEQKVAFRRLVESYPDLTECYIEWAANGPALINDLRREIPGVLAVKPRGSKYTRLEAVSGMIEAGNVYIPDPKMTGCEWVAQSFLEEVTSFPNAPHDDQVDALSQALSQIRTRHRNWNFKAGTVDKEDRGVLALLS